MCRCWSDAAKGQDIFLLIFNFFVFPIATPNNWMVSPPNPLPPPAFSITSSYQFFELLVDCWVSWLIGGHLNPRRHPSLYFLMGLALVPQTEEPPLALPNPMVCALHGTIGSGGAMSCWRRCHTHWEGGERRWRVGWQSSILIVVCCCVVLWVCERNIVL